MLLKIVLIGIFRHFCLNGYEWTTISNDIIIFVLYLNIKWIYFRTRNNLKLFSKVIDIFGYCSTLTISFPGHSEDHISYFINDKANHSM